MPYNDPLVVTLRIGNFNVRRVLIDQGSFAEVMYHDLYKKLSLGETDLTAFASPAFSFSGESIIPRGKTTLPVLAGPINLQTEFLVVQASSPYNAIMGRDWLYRMKAIPSTLHQKLRFPTNEQRPSCGQTMHIGNHPTKRLNRIRTYRGVITVTATRP